MAILSNPPQLPEVVRFVRAMLKQFGLGDMDITIKIHDRAVDCPEKGEVDAEAYTHVDDGYFQGYIAINAFNLSGTEDMDRIVLHEVLHVVLWRLTTMALADAGDRWTPIATAQMEEAVERIARVLVRLVQRLDGGSRPRRRA